MFVCIYCEYMCIYIYIFAMCWYLFPISTNNMINTPNMICQLGRPSLNPGHNFGAQFLLKSGDVSP